MTNLVKEINKKNPSYFGVNEVNTVIVVIHILVLKN